MTNETILHYAYWFLTIGVVAIASYGIYILWANWQERPEEEDADNLNNKAQFNDMMYEHHKYFWYGALMVEVLGLSNAISWAWWAYQDGTFFSYVMRMIFVVTFVGLVITKIYSIPVLLKSYQQGHGGLFTAGLISLGISATFLFLGAYFHLINTSSTTAHERTIISAPIIAVDADINLIREKLNGLARFADETGVQTEYKQNVALVASRESKIKQLQATINNGLSAKPANAQGAVSGKTLAELTGNCSNTKSYYYRFCQQIQFAKTELAGLSITGAATPYANSYQEYMGLKVRLVDLEKRRADLLQSGAGAESWPAHVRFIASVFDMSDEKASWAIWFIIALILDIAGLVFRYVASVSLDLCDDNSYHHIKRTIQACQTLGIDPLQRIRGVLGEGINNVPNTGNIPAYKDGGHVPNDGIANLHAGEYVMPAEAVQLYGKARLEELRNIALSKSHTVTPVKQECIIPEESAPYTKCKDTVSSKEACNDAPHSDKLYKSVEHECHPVLYTEKDGVQDCTPDLRGLLQPKTVGIKVGDTSNSKRFKSTKEDERMRQVSRMKKLLREGVNKSAIARRLSVSRATINNWLKGYGDNS